jgi:RNA polymerase sigma-70 factor, ECF subfamily
VPVAETNRLTAARAAVDDGRHFTACVCLRLLSEHGIRFVSQNRPVTLIPMNSHNLGREEIQPFSRLRPVVPVSEAEIVDSCRRGDRSAFRAIYDAHKDKVYSIALYFFRGDAAMASDVTQQVFLKLITQFNRYRGESALSTYIYRLVVNTCIDTARARKVRALPIENSVAESIAAAGQSQEDAMAQRELCASVQNAVSALPPKFRVAILLRYFEDLSYEEMAKALNCSIGTVASRLSRGHRMLAGTLGSLRHWFENRKS